MVPKCVKYELQQEKCTGLSVAQTQGQYNSTDKYFWLTATAWQIITPVSDVRNEMEGKELARTRLGVRAIFSAVMDDVYFLSSSVAHPSRGAAYTYRNKLCIYVPVLLRADRVRITVITCRWCNYNSSKSLHCKEKMARNSRNGNCSCVHVGTLCGWGVM